MASFQFPHLESAIWDSKVSTLERVGMLEDNARAIEDYLNTVNRMAYGSNNQLITCTVAGLASSTVGAGRTSAAIPNNSSPPFLDALVSAKLTMAAGAPGSDTVVYFYAYGSVDNGTTYTDGATGTDANFTASANAQYPANLARLGTIFIPTGGAQYFGGPWSIAAAFGGNIPQKWGVFVLNISGLSISSGQLYYQGVFLG